MKDIHMKMLGVDEMTLAEFMELALHLKLRAMLMAKAMPKLAVER